MATPERKTASHPLPHGAENDSEEHHHPLLRADTRHTFEVKVKGDDSDDSDVDVEGSDQLQVNQYTLKERLGEGAYGIVRRGVSDVNHEVHGTFTAVQFVRLHACVCEGAALGDVTQGCLACWPWQAVKVLNKVALRKKKTYKREGRRVKVTTALDKAQKELAIMKAVAHPNVVKCFEIIDDPEHDHLFLGAYTFLARANHMHSTLTLPSMV